jgi:hypothetical protein
MMPIGPGKYDAHATTVREATGAGGVVLIVIGGAEGGGFSVQATAAVTLRLPVLLRNLADAIEEDLRGTV